MRSQASHTSCEAFLCEAKLRILLAKPWCYLFFCMRSFFLFLRIGYNNPFLFSFFTKKYLLYSVSRTTGFEAATSGVTSQYYNQLSYILKIVFSKEGKKLRIPSMHAKKKKDKKIKAYDHACYCFSILSEAFIFSFARRLILCAASIPCKRNAHTKTNSCRIFYSEQIFLVFFEKRSMRSFFFFLRIGYALQKPTRILCAAFIFSCAYKNHLAQPYSYLLKYQEDKYQE